MRLCIDICMPHQINYCCVCQYCFYLLNTSKSCMYLCILYADFAVYQVSHMSCCHFVWQSEIWDGCPRTFLCYHNKRQLDELFLLVGTLIKMNESRHLQAMLQNKEISFRSKNFVLTFLQLSFPIDNNWMLVPWRAEV